MIDKCFDIVLKSSSSADGNLDISKWFLLMEMGSASTIPSTTTDSLETIKFLNSPRYGVGYVSNPNLITKSLVIEKAVAQTLRISREMFYQSIVHWPSDLRRIEASSVL